MYTATPMNSSSPVCSPTSSPLRTGKTSSPLRSTPKGPRPLKTPRRPVLATPARQRPFFTPSPRRLPMPELKVINATPPAPRTPPRGSDPYRLGHNWKATPLRMRVAYAEMQANHSRPPSGSESSSSSPPSSRPTSPTPESNGSVLTTGSPAYDPQTHGLIDDLLWVGNAEGRELVTIERNEIFNIIDDVICAIPDADHEAINVILFGKDEDEVDLEVRTLEQLQDLCLAIARELVIVDGKLRCITDF